MPQTLPPPPRQRRSQRTQQRILAAVSGLLEERRFDQISVQEIASRAGVSVGGLYGRFGGKDELIRWFDAQILEAHQDRIVRAFDPALWEGASLAAIARRWVEIAVEVFTEHRALLREIALRSRAGDEALRSRAAAFNATVDGSVVALLLRSRDSIRARDPELAVRLGLLAVSAALREVLLFGEAPRGAEPLDEGALAEEMVRLFVGYLTCAPADAVESAP